MLLARAHPCDYGNFICTFFGHMSSNDESSTQTAPRGNLLHARHANYGQTWGKVACVSQRRRVKRRQKKMIFVKLVGVRSKTQLFPWPTHFSLAFFKWEQKLCEGPGERPEARHKSISQPLFTSPSPHRFFEPTCQFRFTGKTVKLTPLPSSRPHEWVWKGHDIWHLFLDFAKEGTNCLTSN